MIPKAERSLTKAFKKGVDARYVWDSEETVCWLAPHDPERRPCTHKLERFHFIGRQRVRNALYALLPDFPPDVPDWDLYELILLAEWDSRNGAIACEGHHRRYDSHLTPALEVPSFELPDHVLEFVEDWGLEAQLPAPAIEGAVG